MRIYSFIGTEGVYLVVANSLDQARATLKFEIGGRALELKEGEYGMTLAAMYEPDFGYVVARTEEMLSPAMLV